MKKFACFVLSCLLIVMSGCNQNKTSNENNIVTPNSTDSNLPFSSSDSSQLLDVPTDTGQLLTPELVTKILTGEQSIADDPQFAQTGMDGTKNLQLVDQFVASVEAKQPAYIKGHMLTNPIPLLYELNYRAGGNLTLTIHRKINGEPEANTYSISHIYDAKGFYQFVDNENIRFSIPKQSLLDNTIDEGYQPDTDMAGVAVTAAQARERITEIRALEHSYNSYLEANKLAKNNYQYGILIPADFDTIEPDIPKLTAVADGAAVIFGKPYYCVSFYQDDLFMGESYYIDAIDMTSVFCVSMVGGELIPIACQDARQIVVE